MARNNNMGIHYSPLRYPGGKNCIFSFVSNMFYENNLIGINYAEPYAGGSGLALRLLFEGYVNHIYINDLDKSIFAFWRSIINRPDEFCDWIKSVKVNITSWNKYKAMQNYIADIDYFELAKSTFFLNRTNISGVIKGGVIGGQKQKGKYKIDARFNKQDLINRIQTISSLKNHISLSNLDGLSFISNLNKKKEEIFIYLDPPYFNKAADLYMNFYSKNDHTKLSKFVHKMHNKWMISYDNNDFILNLFAEQNKVTYKLSYSASNRVGSEILIFSEGINVKDSIKALNSPVLLKRRLDWMNML
jgi:DNA adenine methylase